MLSEHPTKLVTALFRRGVALDLETVDLCFLAALQLRSEKLGRSTFAEDELFDVFEQVVALTTEAPDGKSTKKRATHLLRRLREQKMLVRVDGAGIVRAGSYALTRLATAIVAFFLEDEALTRESLGVLASALTTGLLAVRDTARRAPSDEVWALSVTAPLRVTLADLAKGIEQRQRGFDLQQEEFQREIGALISADWFGAVERCTTMLETASANLRELNEILLGHTQRLGELLQEIAELAANADKPEAEAAARAATEQVDRIGAWGSARQRAWTDYHEWVHRYLRDVVRLDPSRTLVHRLREQLAGRGARPYALVVANAPPMRVVRTVEVAWPKPPVRRPKKEREHEPTEQDVVDPDAPIHAAIAAAIEDGACGLAEITARVVETVEPEARFRTAGRVAELLPRIARVRAEAERPWESAGAELIVEEWPLRSEEAREP